MAFAQELESREQRETRIRKYSKTWVKAEVSEPARQPQIWGHRPVTGTQNMGTEGWAGRQESQESPRAAWQKPTVFSMEQLWAGGQEGLSK